MKITYFFREKGLSIERIFFCLTDYYNSQNKFEVKKRFAPYRKLSPKYFFSNLLFVFKNRSDLNHITGDIHYVALVLPSKNTILTIHDCNILKSSQGIKRAALNLLWLQIPIWHLKYITAISEKTKEDIIKYTGCKPNKIRVINNPVDTSFVFSPQKFNTNCPKLLVFCYYPNKNTLRVLEAIKDLNVSITLLGKMSAEIENTLIDNNIQYQNFYKLSDDEIIDQYRKCDILVFPSYYEGFGVPVIEAQATGRVVITSNIEPMKSIAADSAHLVDPYSVDSIREGIIKVISDDLYRENLIIKSQVNVKRFSVEKIAGQYEALYNQILK